MAVCEGQSLPEERADAPLTHTRKEELTLEETGYAPVRRTPPSRRSPHPVYTSKGVKGCNKGKGNGEEYIKGKGNGEVYIKGDWMKGDHIVVRQHNERRCWRQERNEKSGEIKDVHIAQCCGYLTCSLQG